MNISRNVVLDLVPVYLAGEASPDTKALVEEFASRDAEIATLLAEGQSWTLPACPGFTSTQEKETLNMTKRLIRLRATLFGLALFLSLVPFTFGRVNGTQFLLLRDAPEQAAVSAVCALAAWAGWFAVRRRLSVSGL
ncbi:MAG TPA: hypothetical protein DEH78_06605 [Solibacterales bacterium]|nr:hypothetical protein [Bryobacterales bacterium]